MDLLVSINVIALILALIILYYSVRLITILRSNYRIGWWTALPLIFAYMCLNRATVLLISMGQLPLEWSQFAAASTIIFWIGMAIFIHGLYQEAHQMIHGRDP
jgi:hypothetical protein